MNLLIVDDDIEIANTLKSLLKKEGLDVDLAFDGEAGSFKARTNVYDLIILDNVMPKKEGSVVCLEIREKGINTPIIMLSALSEADTKVDLLDSGADDYITKPFHFDELMARTRALLRRPKEIESEIINIGDLVIDRGKHMVSRNGEEISLTSREFNLLEYLAKNRGMAMSRAMIMSHVWDVEADPFSNTLETHILNLRKKTSKGDDSDLIRTVAKIGYKID